MSDLASKSCVPCRGGVPALKGKELEDLHRQIPDWQVINDHHLKRSFSFPDFVSALAFVNKVGEVERRKDTIPTSCCRGARPR